MVTIGQVGRLCVVDKKISARRVDIAVKWQRVGIYCSQGNFLSLFLYGLCRGTALYGAMVFLPFVLDDWEQRVGCNAYNWENIV